MMPEKARVYTEADPMWTLDRALEVIRKLALPLATVGWHLALAGGVLLKGISVHDLDLVAFPHDSTRTNRAALEDALRAAGWERTHRAKTMRAGWRKRGSLDEKHVEAWRTPGKRRVDIIIPITEPTK